MKLKERHLKKIILFMSSLLVIMVVLLVLVINKNNFKLLHPEPTILPNNKIEIENTSTSVLNKNNEDYIPTFLINMGLSNSQSKITKLSKEKIKLLLYNKNPECNVPFKVKNMFPGDSVSNEYSIEVMHKNQVTVHFNVDVKPGYEKLSEVLKTKVILKNTGEVLYDGLLKDIPESIDTVLIASDKKKKDVLEYDITAYLDTSVGNEYMDKPLIADFKWWVDNPDDLENLPQTGYSYYIKYVIYIVIGICIVLGTLLIFHKKGVRHNG